MKAKKSLGQNFLSSIPITKSVVRTASIQPDDIILEIGPGKGILTKELLKNEASVVAVEKDEALVEKLKEKFFKEIEEGRLKIITGDILDFRLKDLGLARLGPRQARQGEYKLVANIPYYITGEILRKFLSSDLSPKLMVLMLQREVAKRIAASDGKESVLSISVKSYGKPKYIKRVSRENFNPKPNVDSAILLIEDISKKNFGGISEEKFFKLLKTGFSQKRKFLSNNLKGIFGEETRKNLESCKVPEKARAENLSVKDWKCLALKLK